MNLMLRSSGKTSTEELESLRSRGHIAQSKRLVDMLRKAKDRGDIRAVHFYDVKYINECLERYSFEPEAVDTIELEMKSFERESLIVAAIDNLEKARKNAGKESVFSFLNIVREILSGRDILLEDIGTDLEEIDKLRRIY